MKTSIFQLVSCSLWTGLLLACAGNQNFTIENPGSLSLTDKAVVLSRTDVQWFIDDSIGKRLVIAKSADNQVLPSQCDDLNGDGRWDELVFLCDLPAGDKINIRFEAVDSMPVFRIRTNIRFGRMQKPFEEVTGDRRMNTNDTKFTAPVYQMEGPAWENDVIAFRNYFDARNGMDIFGKLTAEMIMDSVGVNGRDYHTLADWGMDILKVGNSLGAGAIAIGIGDSIYRVGPCEEGTYRLVTEGPVRSVLELNYKNVPAGDRLYNVVHRISIIAGEPFFRSQVWISPLKGDENLVTGIVNLHDIPADTLSHGASKIMYSLGNQGISGEKLGMGIIVPTAELNRYDAAPDSGTGIVSTHLISLKLPENRPASYCFIAAWEKRDSTLTQKENFVRLLKECAGRVSD